MAIEMKEFDKYWYQVTMCDLYKKDEASNIVTLAFERVVSELGNSDNTHVLEKDLEKLKDGCGIYEVDLNFDYMAIEYDCDGYEFELSKDLQRDHDKLCKDMHRLPTNEELKATMEEHLWGWGEKYQ